MAKYTTLCGSLLSLLLAAVFIGCSNPIPKPFQPPPIRKEGVDLDTTAVLIGPEASGKPWLVSQDWVIPQGRTVRIQPGTTIMVWDSTWIDIQGQLLAQGTAEQPITFTTTYLIPEMGQWRGFKIHNPNPGEQSVFEHCIFSYGALYDTDTTNVEARTYRGMLAIENASPTIERCVAIFNQNNAVYMTGAACAPRVRYNIFSKNDASAVRSDTLVQIPTYLGEPGKPDVSFNCVGENSALAFLMGYDSIYFGTMFTVNINRDSCDAFFNLDMNPLLTDPANGDFSLQSCSPCVDAGPRDVDFDPDNTRADMGGTPYVQIAGELRGLINVDALNADIPYRISCNVRIDSGRTLTIPAGTQIEVSGVYAVEVFGRLAIEGTPDHRVAMAPGTTTDLWAGLRFLRLDTLSAPSVLRNADIAGYQGLDVYRSGIEFESCRFEHGFNYGMMIQTGDSIPDLADTVSIRGCTFHSPGEYGINVRKSAVAIRNTLIEDGRGRGISLDSCGDAALILNSIVTGSVTTAVVMQYFCRPPVYNCVFVSSGYYGIQLIDNCAPDIRNTIIAANQRYGLYTSRSSWPVLDFNDVVNNESANYHDQGGADLDVGAGSISADPAFVGSSDFHLGPASPCINAGDPRPEFNDPNGTRNDIGAYGGPGAAGGVGVSAFRRTPAALASK